MEFFSDLIQYGYLSNALAACVLSGITCGVIGTYVVCRRMVFLAGGITHSSFGGTFMQADIEKNLSSKDIDLILSFCQSYGLPFWSDCTTANINVNYDFRGGDIAKDTFLHSIIPFASENLFPVASFVVGLNFFYTDFLLLVGLNHWQDDVNISPLIKGNESRISSLLKINAGFYTPNLNPFVTYWNDSNKCLALNCENIMHLAAYYICIMYQQKVFSFGYIRKCKKCGRLFVTAQSRQQFCQAPCTRQAYYIANKRLQKVIEKN